MYKLEDLKEDLLENKLQTFYIFYGEDYGIRKHYIDKIATFFDVVENIDTYASISNVTKSGTLFSRKQLFIIYNDKDFLDLNENQIITFIKRLSSDYTCIFIYEDLSKSSILSKKFDKYITYFSTVKDNIALEFVDSEMDLLQGAKEELASNCYNNYNNILLETNKIRMYAQAENVSIQNAYEALTTKNQLLTRNLEFDCNLFMQDILTNTASFGYWYKVIQQDTQQFYYSLYYIFNDFLIAYLLKAYGYRDGGKRAYGYGLNWGRVKVLRDLNIIYDDKYLLSCAYEVTKMNTEIKSGSILMEQMADYFFSRVL